MEKETPSKEENPGSSRERNNPSECKMVKKKKPTRSQSEVKMQSSRTTLLGSMRSKSQESRGNTWESSHNQDNQQMVTSSQIALDDINSRTSSISTIGSAHLSPSESQTSGYTTESSYQTATGYELLPQNSSYASFETYYGPPPSNFLQEVHVAIDPAASGEEIQSVRRDLRTLLTNEMDLIGASNADVVYLIAYNYM
ncbi:uncharacterized protein LOC108101237 [Drosophila ficusphila]|uniref:uncharacterized protein LOC108101237 n=1 Tax=Drosophila ficusphila TaxID=30025 RepID=UPI0007E7AC96|nr:uncharacterized protein LOC108101237 [Drosophila ficusphila]